MERDTNWKEVEGEVEEEGEVEGEGEEGEVEEEGEGQGQGEVVDIPSFQVPSLGSQYNMPVILPHPHCSSMSKLVTVLSCLHSKNQCILFPTFLTMKYWGML